MDDVISRTVGLNTWANKLSTIDAVPVVRCRDCAHYIKHDNLVMPECDILQAYTLATSALEKRIPRRLRTTTSTKRCPACNKQISGINNIHSNFRYCKWCGQALRWD